MLSALIRRAAFLVAKNSATKIQSVHRMRQGAATVQDARVRLEQETKQKALELASALLVQKAARKWKAKKTLAKLKMEKRELDSSVKIQSVVRGRRDKKRVGELRQKRLELNSALLVQKAVRKWKAKKTLNGLKHKKKQLESSIKIQSIVRGRRDKKRVEELRQKRLELNSALLVQQAARKWKAKKTLNALRKQKQEHLAAIRIQALERGRQGRGNVGAMRRHLIEAKAATKIQGSYRGIVASREWRSQIKAVHTIGRKIRTKLARQKMKRQKLERELTFKLKAVLAISVHRLVDGVPCPTPQKISTDVEMTKLSISWLPPVRGKNAVDKGGKRSDEHPMRMETLRNVTMEVGEALPEAAISDYTTLAVENTDGRIWRLAFIDKQECAMVLAGLRSHANIKDELSAFGF